MTYSILVHDEETGRQGGAAATGSLCVGGWVLRGDSRAGMSASQGSAPSTLWGEDVLDAMRRGVGAAEAVEQVVTRDSGRAHRQLAALDAAGHTGAFTGTASIPEAYAQSRYGIVATGNMLAGRDVLDAVIDGYLTARGPLGARLLAALEAGAAAGGDYRGLRSAALLVVGNDMPPLSLRIDMSDAPLEALGTLYAASQAQPYAGWIDLCPTRNAPQRPGS